MRSFADGYVAILLPLHLVALGYDEFDVGLIATATMIGSALMTLAVGLVPHGWRRRTLMLGIAAVMVATGIAFGAIEALWPLLVVAFFGTINPSMGDVSAFVPLEHAVLAQSVAPEHRTALFARYAVLANIVGALGALSVGFVDVMGPALGRVGAIQAMFFVYAALGCAIALLYSGLTRAAEVPVDAPRPGLGPSRRRVYMLAALFSLDSFGGGFFLNSMIAAWLYSRYGIDASTAGAIFFATNLCAAASQLVAVRVAQRFGAIRTMVFTHLPANLLVIGAGLAPSLWVVVAFLVVRSLLSQMDVPLRSSYVMAVVRPEERAAAASLTQMPRSLATALSPWLAKEIFALSLVGWPLVIGGLIKVAYDVLLLRMFADVKPPEERKPGEPQPP
ncbi:MAG: MFS transporter [Alphaproteobacteria bacterium]|nr:MFS transporter [Alphaproteobacteria bacterium]